MSIYITTAIDYPNALPHIGTAFEKIGADAFARWKRFQNCKVHFLMGNDENTLKVVEAAGGRDVQEYVNEKAEEFKKVWDALDISYDCFLQTSSPEHRNVVQYFLSTIKQAGYIEKRTYASLYCNGCEEFKTQSNLLMLDGYWTCPNHKNQKLINRFEENYFFCLSKFKDRLKRLLDNEDGNDFRLTPITRYNEIKQFLEEDLQDVSISREVTAENKGWGIPIPWDDTQVVYVWADALLSYLTGLGFGANRDFNQSWPADVHFVGKDIVRFHATLFPAMIMAYNEFGNPIQLPENIFGHGFIQQKNELGEIVKSSKSGDAINPMDLVNQYGSDAVRYSFLNRNFGADSEFSFAHFRNMYNADLANGFGNLTSRVVAMIDKFCAGEIPKESVPYHKLITRPAFDRTELYKFMANMNNYDYQGSIKQINDIVNICNQEIDLQEPWRMSDAAKRNHLLRFLAVNLKLIGLLLTPLLPKTAEKIYNCFVWEEKQIYSTLLDTVEGFQGAVKVNGECLPLFPRVA